MSTLDILFWLMIVLLGGIAWAIESGLATRHKRVLLTSTLSALGSILFIMFWIEDNSVLVLGERPDSLGKRTKGGDRGTFHRDDVEGEEGKQPTNDANASTKEKTGDKDANKEDPKDKPEDAYSRDAFRDCPSCPEMVIVPKGSFTFGMADAGSDLQKPAQVASQVFVKHPFAIGKMEILRKEYAAFVTEAGHASTAVCDAGPKRRGKFNWQTPGFEQDGRHPVVCVDWADANAFVDWLSAKTKRSYRIPTELEWEYAARATTSTQFFVGEDLLAAQANIARTRDGTVPGGLFLMNKFGLSDVAGNAWELTASCASGLDSEQQASGQLSAHSRPQASVQGPTQTAAQQTTSASGPQAMLPCSARIIKGGSWNSSIADARHGARSRMGDIAATNAIGFRIIRAVDGRDADKLLTSAQLAAVAAGEKRAEQSAAKEKAATEKAAFDAREAAFKAREKAKADADKAKVDAAAAAAKAAAKAKTDNKT